NMFNKVNKNEDKLLHGLANLDYATAKHIDQLENVLDEVKLVAHKHRGLGVKPEHYPIVGKYLLLAIKEVLVDDATNDIMNAWEEAYGVIAQVLFDIENIMYEESAEKSWI